MTRTTWIACVLGVAVAGCLPIDTRPPPGKLHVSVHGNQALAEGVPRTSDGWSIQYDRFLVTIGHSWAAGDACDAYSDADYARIIDARRGEPQKLSLIYADGRCGLAFAITGPNESALLTAGVTEDDKTFLRQIDSGNPGISMRVEGRATDGARSKRFGWSYFRYAGYYCDLEGEPDGRFVLNGDNDAHATVALRGEALFELDRELAPGVLRFAPFAEADDLFGDGDGEIADEELERSPSTDLEAFGTLRGQLDSSLFPAVPALEQGPCETVPLNGELPESD